VQNNAAEKCHFSARVSKGDRRHSKFRKKRPPENTILRFSRVFKKVIFSYFLIPLEVIFRKASKRASPVSQKSSKRSKSWGFWSLLESKNHHFFGPQKMKK